MRCSFKQNMSANAHAETPVRTSSSKNDNAGSPKIPWKFLIGVGLLLLLIFIFGVLPMFIVSETAVAAAEVELMLSADVALRELPLMAGDTLFQTADCGSRMKDCIAFLLLAAANSICIGDATITAGEAENTLLVHTTGQNYQTAVIFAHNAANLGYATEFTGFLEFTVSALIVP